MHAVQGLQEAKAHQKDSVYNYHNCSVKREGLNLGYLLERNLERWFDSEYIVMSEVIGPIDSYCMRQ